MSTQTALADSLVLTVDQLAARVEALAPYRAYGPSYRRGVVEGCQDVDLFAGRGDLAAATHYLVMAEKSAGLLTWDEVEALDPFRCV